jgi:23S rRNA G2445 N2-methylase RlmL
MPETQRVFFDVFSLEYYEEKYAEAVKEVQDKAKFEREHKMDSPMTFDAHQDLLRIARENAGQPQEGEDE